MGLIGAAFITTTVSGRGWDSFYVGERVVQWIEYSLNGGNGKSEAVYCSVQFEGDQGGANVQIGTLVGTENSPRVDMEQVIAEDIEPE